MVFSSKKDIWMGIIIWSMVFASICFFYLSILDRVKILGIGMAIVICFLGAIWFNTRYNIEKDTLKISYGIIKKSIDIQEIKSIRKTTNPFVAPSLSVHRIEINYGKYETIQVSPKNTKLFINELQMKNKKIQINN